MGQTLVSINFVVFLILVLAIYYSLARRYQWVFLLAVSYFFYGITTRWEFVLLLAGVSGINYFSGLLILRAPRKSKEKLFLRLGIGLNVCLLILFKYLHFWRTPLLPQSSKPLAVGTALAVPLGISYFIFKAIAYVIDVYRNKQLCEHNIGKFSLFMAFFPEISAGPIDRAKNLLAQISIPKAFVEADMVSGLRLILWGYFKKIVIANNLAGYVNQVYGAPREYSGITLVIITYFLAIQIYADFSGYTDIARGIGRMLGYSLPANFDTPYLSVSISDFWTRWHMTLSTWLRDYLFLPISFFLSRRIKKESFLLLNSNVVIYFSSALVTFMLAGVWHGSAWTYVIWGLLHGLFLSFSNLTKKLRKKFRQAFPIHLKYPRLVSVGRTLLCFHLVTFTWIFFRASSVKDALYIIRNLVPLKISGFVSIFIDPQGMVNLGASKYGFVISVLVIVFLLGAEIGQKGKEIPPFLTTSKRGLRWAAYYLLFMGIFLLGEFGLKEFIYVQF